jgi:hypothetical protein
VAARDLEPNPTLPRQKMVEQRETLSESCTARLTAFVHELEELLSSNPSTVYPITSLLATYFPVTNCDAKKVEEVCRTSKFFTSMSNEPKYYSFNFNSKGHFKPYHGFFVTFALLKNGGNSSLPFARVNID